MAVPYHTHSFEIPSATKAEVEAGVRNDVAATPSSLGSASAKDVAYFATAEQGGKANTAVQPSLTLIAGTGLAGGGTLAENRTFALSSTSIASLALANSAIQPARQVIAGNGLTGGGTLAADRTISLDAATQASLVRADAAVQPARTVSAGTGLAGGGDLSANRSLALNSASISSLAKADTAVQPSRAVIAGTGLSGGGDLSADRNLALSTGTLASLAKADTAIQAPGGAAGQVLTKNSAADGDASWQTVAAATAVSYAPQELTEPQKTQAKTNIGVQPVSTATVGAAIAGANGKTTPADGDFFSGVEAGGSTMFKTTWANIKAALQTIYDSRYLRLIGGTLTAPLYTLYPRSNTAVGERNYTPAYVGRIGNSNLEVTFFGEERIGTDVRAVISAKSGSVINYFAFTHWGDAEIPRNVTCIDVRATGWVYAGTASFRADGGVYGSIWTTRFGNANAAEGIYNRIEARGFDRTRDYLLSEVIPVGGFALLRYSGTTINPQSVGGGELQWSNSNGDISSPLNYGTFQPIGTTNTASNAQRTTIWKRIG
ncbi:hypothetical protein [Ochrobactrum sp. EDr1-4]|uniref:hypothetical protein n=1 Tax=Ochrobactrum sp. EDr1-4 TaxID=3368622 RepID=UPI003BA251A5